MVFMCMKEFGCIDGFYGWFGNFGVIDKKYDVVILMVCG